MGGGSDDQDKDFVQAFARGLEVIRAFDSDHPQMTLSEVAERTGLTRATARRLLLTLVSTGYALSDRRGFRLAPRILDLGYAYLSSLDIWERAQVVLTDVTRELGESCSACVLDGDEAVYVARVAASRITAVNLRVGARLPAFHTSTGRMLLAHLPILDLEALLEGRVFERYTDRTITDVDAIRDILRATRQRGWSLSDQEFEVGLMSVAVPLRDRAGRVTAAINVSAHTSQLTAEALKERALPLLFRAAERIGAV
jgi:IclR family pca regulon transcriptional regulator